MEGSNRERNNGEQGNDGGEVGRGLAADRPPAPVTFEEAEAINPFDLLTDLHDHAMALRLDGKPPTFHLTELALSAAVVAWWSRWQPISMHRAFLAGASLGEVAAAAGATETEVYGRWSDWAERQSNTVIARRAGVDANELAAIRGRLAGASGTRISPRGDVS